MAEDKKRVKRRDKKNISNGVAHVNSTFNNTMITISDEKGDAISWSSAGLMGFKGQENQLLLQPKWLQKMLEKKLKSMVLKR